MTNDENTPIVEQDENDATIEESEIVSEDSNQEEESAEEEDTTDWKAEALKYKAILDRNKDKKHVPKESSKKSNDLDYGEKAYLTANGIKGAKEFEFVKAELKASGENLDNLLENDYFKSKLEKFREINKTADAIPKGGRSNSVPTDSVEYWMAKPIEEVPKDMRAKVVNAKLTKDKDKGVFYNS